MDYAGLASSAGKIKKLLGLLFFCSSTGKPKRFPSLRTHISEAISGGGACVAIQCTCHVCDDVKSRAHKHHTISFYIASLFPTNNHFINETIYYPSFCASLIICSHKIMRRKGNSVTILHRASNGTAQQK